MIFDAENFPDLPETWQSLPVSEACSLVSISSKIKQKEYSVSGKLPVVDQGAQLIGGFTDDLSAAVTTELPVVVFGDHTRVLKYIDFPFAAGADGIKILRPIPGIYPRLFYHFLRAIRLPDKGYARHFQHLRNAHIALPPEGEQKRIADKLDRLLAAVDSCKARLDAIPAILKRFRQSVLAAATSGALTEEWRAGASVSVSAQALLKGLCDRHEEKGTFRGGNAAAPVEGAHDLDETSLPDGWVVSPLAQLCEPGRPITYGILKPGPDLLSGIPYVRVADFPDDKLNLSTVRYTSEAIDKQFARSRLREGDLLISIRGTVGRLCFIPKELEGANITQDSARLSIDDQVNPYYVALVLRSDAVRRRMARATKGVAVRGINIGDLRVLQIPLPPREEQDEILRRVDRIFSLGDLFDSRMNTARKRVTSLAPRLLEKAFCGEILATQCIAALT